MNKIYKVVWNKARNCYVVGSELMKTHQGKKSSTRSAGALSKAAWALFWGLAGWGAACNFIYADVTVADPTHTGTVSVKDIAGSGKQYDIHNQQVSGNKALNKFKDFDIGTNDVANMHLDGPHGNVDHQINLVQNKMNVDGVVNAIKNNKIGGDVYFFSDKGIAIGANGVFNVGRLTLGTNVHAGEVLFNGTYKVSNGGGGYKMETMDDFVKKSPAERGQLLNDLSAWGATSIPLASIIDVAGTINASDSVVLANSEGGIQDNWHGTGISISKGATIQTGTGWNDFQAGQAADHYRNSLINTKNVKNATNAIATTDGIALVADKDISMAGNLISNGRTIDLVTKDNLHVKGESASKATLRSDGGKIRLTASSDDAKLQADSKDKPVDGMISIKDAYIDSSSDTKDSGNIEITAVRKVMGTSRVEIDDSTIDASGRNGKNAGDVAIHATAETQLYAWDIGDGAYAQIAMGKNGSGRNTIKGDNVDMAAKATTTGHLEEGDSPLTDAEIEAAIKNDKNSDGILDTMGTFIKDYGGNFRSVASVTITGAEASVDIEKTDITAVGGNQTGTDGKERPHGNVTIASDASSSIIPYNLNLIGIGFNVGIGKVKSHVNVDNSKVYAAKDISMNAKGTNTVNLKLSDFSLLDDKMAGLSLDVSWAELHSDVSAKVGSGATLTSQGNTSMEATSVRTLGSSASNCGNTLSLAAAVGIADTKATADMAGTVYAGGDVSVKAKNTLDNEKDDDSGVYTADTVTAASVGGDTPMKPTADLVIDEIKREFADTTKDANVKKDLETEKTGKKSNAWNRLGMNAATALLFSDNEATASVTGKVRGVDEAGKGSDTVGAKSLSVAADTLSRSKATVGAYQNDTTESGGDTTKKDITATASVAYMQQKNHSEAYISGDTKTKGDTTVQAETKIPWQTNWAQSGVNEFMQVLFASMDTNVGVADLVDSWSQAAGNGDKISGAASISVVNYDNSAKAYIGKKDKNQATAPKVEADGNVSVAGKTDITTVNFAGSIQSIFQAGPINFFAYLAKDKGVKNLEKLFNKNGWTMDGASKAGVGGAALAVHQKNDVEAYIDDGAIVTAGKDVDVNAKANAWNLAMNVAGGMAKSVAVDASVGVSLFDNTTKAYIGEATVKAKDVNVEAEDKSESITAAGGIGVSGGTGIGASVAYNHIIRDTEAAIHGNVTADGIVGVDAKNTGEIIAASVAGAVTYDQKAKTPKKKTRAMARTPAAEETDTGNGAGSTGFHAVEDGDVGSDTLTDFVDSMIGEGQEAKEILEESKDKITEVTKQDKSMQTTGTETGMDSAKGGMAAAANVSVNRIKDTAKAYVAKKDKTNPSITADALRVSSVNDSKINTSSMSLAVNAQKEAKGSIAGSFMYNSIEGNNQAYVEDATLTLRGNQAQDADESLTVSAENKEEIKNTATSGTVAAKGAAVAGQISLNWLDNTTDAHVKNSTIRANEAMQIKAKDNAVLTSGTGVVSIAPNSTAVGAAIGVNLVEGDTTSYVEDSEVKGTDDGKSGGLAVSAEEASKVVSIVASGAASGGFSGAFSGSGNWIHTKTDAHISNEKDMKTGTLSVKAGNHSTATLGVGGGSFGENAVGAAMAVMVNDSTVNASLTGDTKKEKTISADGITVEADNAYNGSASDSSSDSSAKTVAIGMAGGTSQFAGSGSVTVNKINQTTHATMGKGKYEANDKAVSVEAKNKANLFGMAGGLTISAGSGVGAAVDVQTYDGHTYAGIEDGVSLKKASQVTVNAESEENLMSIGATVAGAFGSFAGAGAAGAHSIKTDTKAYIGNDKDETIAEADQANLTEAGNVSVTAKDTTKLHTAAGSGGVGSSAGVGLSAAVEVVNKNVTAYVGNHASVSGDSLTVKAENTSDSLTEAADLGVGGTAGVAGAASETFVNHTTNAYVGKNAKVSAKNAADIQAMSSFKQKAGAGGVGGAGNVGIGLANSTVSLDATTKAYADNGAHIFGGKKVNIQADHTSDLTYATVAGGGSGTIGVSGAVGVNTLHTTTKAYGGTNTELSAESAENNEGISVTASDTTKLHGGNGGAAIGISAGGIGAAEAVTNITKDTEAYVDTGAKLDSNGQITLDAKNTENMLNVSVQAAGGAYAGLAGAVNVVNLDAITKAYTNTGVAINQKDGGNISVNATHEIEKMENAVAGAAGGAGASIGAAVDVVNIKTQTNAYLGDRNVVDTKGDVSILAKDNMHDIASRAYAASIGSFGLSGSISIYNIGSTMSDADKANLNGNDGTKDTDFDTWLNSQLNQSGTQKAMSAYDSEALSDVKGKLKTNFASEAPDTTGEKGTLAKIGNSTTIHAGGDVNVKADDTLAVKNTMGNVSGSTLASVGASVNVVNTDTQTKALIDKAAKITSQGNLNVNALSKHTMTNVITGASVAVTGVAGQGTIQTWKDHSDVFATIGNTKGVSAKSISVNAKNDRTLDSTLVGASVALYGALNGAVITADVSGKSEAGIGDDDGTLSGEVQATEGDITISSTADTDLKTSATGAVAGMFAGTGTGVDLKSDVSTKSFVGVGEKLSGKNISITSKNTPKLDALATSAGVGLAGVGATVVKVASEDSSHVVVHDGAKLTAGNALSIQAKMTKPIDGENAKAWAIAGGGGVVAGAVSVVDMDMKHITDVAIGKNVTIEAKKADISAVYQTKSYMEMESVAAGQYSGTGGETNFKETSDVNVTIGDSSTISTDDETTIQADNLTEKSQKVTSGGAALASGNGIVSDTTITHNAKANIGKVTMKANAAELSEAEKAAGKTIHDKNAITIDARSNVVSSDDNTLTTGSVVGAAHVKNTHTVNATTETTVADGATLLAGETEKANQTWEGDNKDKFEADSAGMAGGSYRGGSIGVGSRNDASISATTLVDVFGAAGYAGSENDVTYTGKTNTTFNGKAETAKGDIRTAAGRDNTGATGKITVLAHSDLLNATAIPISIKRDPKVMVNSDAKLTIGSTASLRSDRDVYLQSQAGNISAVGSGEVKDWVNAVAEAFGSEGYKMGKSQKNTSANAEVNGLAETGIHRHLFVKFWGVPDKDKDGQLTGKWRLYVDRNGEISYTISGSVPVGADLYKRLDELDGLQGDSAAMAAYDAERKFIEAKLVEQGLGYYNGEQFIRMPISEASEYDEQKKKLNDPDYEKGQLDQKKLYQDAKTESEAQSTALQPVTSAYEAWKNASNAESTAKTAYDAAKTATTTAEAAKNAAKDDLINSIDSLTEDGFSQYLKDHAGDQNVVDYTETEKAYYSAVQAESAAKKSYEDCKADTSSKASAYESAAGTYDTKYGTAFKQTPTEDLGIQLTKEATDLKTEQDIYQTSINQVDNELSYKKKQVEATDYFFAHGGSENEKGEFWLNGEKLDGNSYPYGEGSYVLLHKNAYARMTHEITLNDMIAQLGDIHLEGDNVYGNGQLKASGDASVTVENRTPYNLNVKDIKVVGKGGETTVGTGGMIFFNDSAMSGASANDIKASIQERNKDKTKNVSFGEAETRNSTTKPKVTITNTFKPTDPEYTIKNSEKDGVEPLFSAPALHIKGLIYNPRGSVDATSASGDVYNEGSINGGTISVTATNGDYIQSYNPSYRMSNIGGTPLDDSGNLQEANGVGILANGNIFISARYVNINSTIQSGIEDWNFTIPEDFTLYYKEADGTIHGNLSVEDAKKVEGAHTFYVAGKDGTRINLNGDQSDKDTTGEQLTYDISHDRFVLDNVEVHGGHVSVVGTIINTAKDGATTGKIKALDGYGTIRIDNRTDKTLELRNLNTGEGVEGTIQITDLDKTTGEVRQKVTYTRGPNGISMSVEKADGAKEDKVLGGDKTTYQTDKDMYYSYQTGRDSSKTNRYEYHGTRVDWFGIEDKTPTLQQLLDIGGQLISSDPGVEKVLNGGYYVSSSDNVNGKANSGNYYTTSDTTYANAAPVEKWDIKSKRLWYTAGLAKKWDVVLERTESNTTVKQFSVKADNPVGIEFFGNQDGGTMNISSKGDVFINGVLHNKQGDTSLTGRNISQSEIGYVDTKSLSLNATGNAGSKNGALQTNATDVTGKAGGNLYVSVADHGVSVGQITAGGVASITAADGIKQKDNVTIKANRVELDVGSGSISGKDDKTAFMVETGKPEDGLANADYGLKASAHGDISIENTTDDLYLDSVISENGDVTLTTRGSFIDNNFTDTDDVSASDKLNAWAKSAVLEGSQATIDKQKKLLIAKVQDKYNEYQSLSMYVKDGVYTLDEGAKEALTKNGVTDIDGYMAEKQARYEVLKDTVGTWNKSDVEAYIKEINDSKDSTLYGNASLTANQLTSDTYLTADEKATILVGSAKTDKDLLITFAPGGIKEGITDTNTIIKQVPHVSGNQVTLTALGTNQEAESGNIGEKKNDISVDLSSREAIDKLTSGQLLALASAERGDLFAIDKDTMKGTISTVRSIDAEAKGKLTAKAEHGSIYLVSEGTINPGSTLKSGGEVRLKASGSVNDITIGSNEQTVLESGEGAISGVKVTGNGVLTARAKAGVDISKEDGDLVINTIYASEGDVTLDLNKGSLKAEKDQEENEKLHMEGKNISIKNATNIGEDNSIGMKVTGQTDVEGKKTAGSIWAENLKTAKVTIFGELEADTATKIAASEATITNKGTISGGTMTGDTALHLTNDGVINGGQFLGGMVSMTNNKTIAGGTYTAVSGDLSYEDTASSEISGGHLAANAGNVNVTSHGKLAIDAIKAKEEVKVTSDGDARLTEVSAGEIDITSTTGNISGNTMISTNGDINVKAGKNISVDTLTSSRNLTMDATGNIIGGTVHAERNAMLHSVGSMNVTSLTANKEASVSSGSDATLATVNAGSVTIDVKGNVHSDSLTSTKGDVSVKAGKNISMDVVKSARNLTMDRAGNIIGGTIHADQNAMLHSNGSMNVTGLTANEEASISSGSDATLAAVNAGSVTIDVKGNVHSDSLTSAKGDVRVKAEKNISVDTLTSSRNLTMDAAGNIIGGTVHADQNAMLHSGDSLNVANLSATEEASVSSDKDAVLATVNAGSVTIDVKGNVHSDSLTSAKGDVSVKAGENISMDVVTSARNLTMDIAGNIIGGTVHAERNAMLHSGGSLNVANLSATEEASVSSDKDATLAAVNAGSVTIDVKGNVNSDSLTSTKGDVSVKAGKNISVDKLTSSRNLTMDAAGNIIGGAIHAERNAMLHSNGSMNVTNLTASEEASVSSGSNATLAMVKAGSININAKGNVKSDSLTSTEGDVRVNAGKNISVDKLTSSRNLIIDAAGNIIGGTIHAEQNAMLHSGSSMNIANLSAKEEAGVSSDKDATFATVNAGNVTIDVKGNMKSDSLTSTEGDVSVNAGGNISVDTLTSARNLTMKADGKLFADTITANGNAGMTSHGSMVIGELKTTTGDATLASENDDVDLSVAEIGHILSINAKTNVKLRQAKSVSMKVTAEEGNIEATAKDASLSSGNIELVAGDTIRISDKETVDKLTGVDTSQVAGAVFGSGNRGSLITGEGKGHDFDVSKKGSARLTSSTGNIKLKAKTMEADTIQAGTEKMPGANLTVSADHMGIDDLTSNADRLDVTVIGKDGTTQSRYAGIHTTSDGDVILKDSQVEYLNFTGKDRIGMENTALGGDSVIATDKVTIRLDKNPSRPVAEGMGRLFVNGQDITSDRRFTDVRNGITLNGQRFPETATSVMNKSLYGNDSLGKDGKAKEEREGQDQKREIFFAPITDRESYQTVK